MTNRLSSNPPPLQIAERLRSRELAGAMIWQVCYSGYPGDEYVLTPENYKDYARELDEMLEAVKGPAVVPAAA